MQIFISWSGEQSKQLGEAIRAWLPLVLQSVEPYFSPVDIDTGARWYGEIVGAHEKSNVGLIVLTPGNLSSQWIMFEAGAIARSVERARVCPILFGIRKADLKGPLSFFQAAEFDQEGFQGVVKTINKALEKPLAETALDKTFAQWWPQLEDEVETIMAKQHSTETVPRRSAEDLLEEILLLTRTLSRQQQEQQDYARALLHNPLTHSPYPSPLGVLPPSPDLSPYPSAQPPWTTLDLQRLRGFPPKEKEEKKPPEK